MNLLIYIGLAINIIGDIYLMIYAIKYHRAFKEAERFPARKDELKAEWLKKREIGFGMIIAGPIIAIIGCTI